LLEVPVTSRPRKKVLLTRSKEDCAAWSRSLERRGIETIELPCITTERLDTPGVRSRLVEAVARADWLVLTSKRGAEAAAAMLPAPLHCRVAAVGPATAETARAELGRIDFVAEGGTARALGDELVTHLAGAGPVVLVLALAENAGATLANRLRDARHEVSRIDVYRTIAVHAREPKRPYSSLGSDAIFLASPSAVEGLLNQVSFDIDADIYTIGPSTTAAAQRHGLEVRREAHEPSLEGLLEASQCLSTA
jgi:uroporphyrinogen-III synthase